MLLATNNGHRVRRSTMDAIDFASIAADAASSLYKPPTKKSAPLASPTRAGSDTSATTISPAFQQSFTPQVSPVIQVSTGGGSQTASTTQIAPGGQAARGGGASAIPETSSAPGIPTYRPEGAMPAMPSAGFDYERYRPADIQIQQRDWMPTVLGLVGAGVLMYVWTNR